MGLLTMTGTLDLSQFWPAGNSDADTAKVLLAPNDPFVFQAHPGAPSVPTSAFEGASAVGKGKTAVIDNKNRVTVRFQGIDAPELHFPPHQRRQHFGEFSTNQLRVFLQTFQQDPLPCRVVTQVTSPNDVFDTFGRFIGDIIVTRGGQAVNLNHWLAAEGLAFPSLYNSMSVAEMNAVIQPSDAARAQRKGIWENAGFTQSIGTLDKTLVFRRPPAAVQPDAGRVIFPKFFRRLSTWQDDKAKGKTKATTLKAFLAKEHPPDQFLLTRDVLASGVTTAQVHNLAEAINGNNRITRAPKEMVFTEKPSQLLDKNGNPVTSFA